MEHFSPGNDSMNNQRRFLFIVIIIIAVSWLDFLDKYGETYTTKSLTHAAATYGVARGMNAIVSVLQSTEVSIGVASISPGQFLDPLNDLIERFSWIVMVSMASLGLQKLLLTIASSMVFKILLTLTGLLLIFSIEKKNTRLQNAIIRLFVVSLFLRFAMGAVVWANDLVEYYFLEAPRKEASAKLIETKNSLTTLSQDVQKNNGEQSWWEGMKDAVTSLTSGREQIIEEQTNKASNSIIDLVVVYVAQTILFPLIFFWVFYRMMRWVWFYPWGALFRSEPIKQVIDEVQGS
jgi:hypothetical protein